jgi:hypothetical protein
VYQIYLVFQKPCSTNEKKTGAVGRNLSDKDKNHLVQFQLLIERKEEKRNKNRPFFFAGIKQTASTIVGQRAIL